MRLFSVLLVLTSMLALGAKPEAKARAEALEGKKAFDTGLYEQAITHYEAAYRIKPAPGLLFNLAQSHRRAGHLERATFYFKRYLETNPAQAQAEAVEKIISQLQVEQDEEARAAVAAREREEAAAREAQAREADGRKLELERARLAAAQTEAEALRRKAELEAALKASAAPPPPPIYTRWWFWTAAGVVVVGATTGIVAATVPRPTPTSFPDINAR
jgi:tetratricopeptide (TPR) repeat protein